MRACDVALSICFCGGFRPLLLVDGGTDCDEAVVHMLSVYSFHLCVCSTRWVCMKMEMATSKDNDAESDDIYFCTQNTFEET